MSNPIKILRDNKINVTKEGLVSLEDLVKATIESKNIDQYIARLKKKCTLIKGRITITECKRILSLSNKVTAKKLLKKLKGLSKDPDPVKNEIILTPENTRVDMSLNIFQYGGHVFDVVFDKDENDKIEIWFDAIVLAEHLGYSKPQKAIDDHIKNHKNITTFAKLNHKLNLNDTHAKPKTQYINISGFSNLIHKSNKPLAIQIKTWLDDEVIPSLMKYGYYEMMPQTITLPKFYEENGISKFENKKVVYIGYVGKHGREYLFKYGISSKIYERDFKQHRQTFTEFEIVHIEETDNNEEIEKRFERDLKSYNIHREIKLNGKKQTELFCVTARKSISMLINHMKTLVRENPLPNLANAQNEIQKRNDIITEHDKQREERMLDKKIKLESILLEKSKQELEKSKQELEKSKQELEKSKQELEKSKQEIDFEKYKIDSYERILKMKLDFKSKFPDALEIHDDKYNLQPNTDNPQPDINNPDNIPNAIIKKARKPYVKKTIIDLDIWAHTD
jgi:prophage antirepressor-like protein